ncbi:hypothetical protein QO010_003450 [Caulobacter ginsengisoli]|uniref:Uncharacterized protein n=1 Tax=Caulobacter ginsengisoli TaxID=400775 RepID=A0ABU0IWD4_9CAUL|nr:hypothetical protein [Caulobacter ginsengisoli]MDQ0465661.1 hypothetical protein [Caulobacter ginsengisoli]
MTTFDTETRPAALGLRGWNPPLTWAGLAFLAMMIPTAWLALHDPRTFNGVNVWDKPLKFELSIAIFLLMAGWVFTRLPSGWARTGWGRYTVWTPIVASLGEMAYIAWRASRAEASHFNQSTLTAIVLYAVMGVGALALSSTALVQGIAVLRTPNTAGDNPVFRAALGWGLVLTFVLGASLGGYMSAQTSHWVGGIQSDAAGLPLFGWSTTGGDLRPPHFLGIHASQIIPVAALVIIRLFGKAAGLLTGLFVAGYIALAIAVFVQALMGLPLIAL